MKRGDLTMSKILSWIPCLVISSGLIQVNAETSKITVQQKSTHQLKVESLTLTEDSLGPLKLSACAKITVATLRKTFPSYKIEASVGQTDGPDMYFIKVKDQNGQPLFKIFSAIEGEHERNVKLDQPISLGTLTVTSSNITDQNGLKVGDSVAQIIKKFGNPQQAALNHTIGLQVGKLCYDVGESEGEPPTLTAQDMIKANWKINSISWPKCSW